MPAEPSSSARLTRLSDDDLQRIAHAIADPCCFAILQQIARQDQLPCTALTAHTSLAPATVSHHTKTLQEGGLIDTTRAGRGVSLTLRRDTWNAYLQQLAEF